MLLSLTLSCFVACRRFQECLWGNERKVADVDTQGVEDPKLFVWPGKVRQRTTKGLCHGDFKSYSVCV
jgi:hypothetical protein